MEQLLAGNKQKHYCINCRKEIYYTSKRCKSCSKKGKLNYNFDKHFDRYDISKKYLIKEYVKKDLNVIQ